MLVALASGIAAASAHPMMISWISKQHEVFNNPLIEYLAFVALAPLIVISREQRNRAVFGLWWFAAFAFFFLCLFWVEIAMSVFGNIPLAASYFVLSLLCGFCGLFWAAPAGIATFASNTLKLPFWMVLPPVWTAFEFTRNYFFTGFPWAHQGHSQVYNLPVLQLASVTGVYGISFVLVLANSVVAEIWIRFRAGVAPPKRAIIALGAVMCTVYVGGYARLALVDAEARDAPRVRVALLQGNIDQGIKNKSGFYQRDIERIYNRLLKDADTRGADLIIWPEAAYPKSLDRDDPGFAGRLDEKSYHAHQVIGSPTYFYGTENSGKRYRGLHNSAFFVRPDLSVVGRYDKSHLVPFGEYVPWEQFLPIKKIVRRVGRFMPGTATADFNWKHGNFGVLICYEGIFPEIARAFANQRAEYIVNVTNDAWYGFSSAPFQHLAFYAFRAVETNRFIARSTNTGISAIIDSAGRIRDKSPLYTEFVVHGTVARLTAQTIYTRIGDVFALICTALTVVLWAAALRVRPRTAGAAP